jgi:hypothetical protein
MTFEQLQKKIIVAEKTKEEALQARESLTSLVHKMEKKYARSFLCKKLLIAGKPLVKVF